MDFPRALLLPAGLLVVAAASLDVLWTALWIEGHAGPIGGRLTSWINRATNALLRRRGHKALSLKGPVMLAASVAVWTLLLWLGWTLFFCASAGAILESHTKAEAGVVDRVYYVGYTLFTIGNGDFGPAPGLWRIATALAGMNGLVLVTLVVTYLLAVIEAVVGKRSFATQVFALGRSGAEMVRVSWDGNAFRAVELQLLSIVEQLNLVTEQHQAYPMLHYYHPQAAKHSVATAVAAFDEFVLLLGCGVAPTVRPAPAILRAAGEAVRGYLDTLHEAYVQPADELPPSPRLDPLREAGIPTVSDAELAAVVRSIEQHRRLLCAVVRAEYREWPGDGGRG